MIRVFGPVHVSAEDWPEWRRTIRPLLRIAAALLIFIALMTWTLFAVWLAKHVRF